MNRPLPEAFARLCDQRMTAGLTTSAEQLRWLKNAALADTCHIFRDGLGRPMGYAIWARVNRESLARLARTQLPPEFPYEWYEGGITLLLDLVVQGGLGRGFRCQLRALLKAHRLVAYMHKGDLKIWRRQGGWHRRLPLPEL